MSNVRKPNSMGVYFVDDYSIYFGCNTNFMAVMDNYGNLIPIDSYGGFGHTLMEMAESTFSDTMQ